LRQSHTLNRKSKQGEKEPEIFFHGIKGQVGSSAKRGRVAVLGAGRAAQGPTALRRRGGGARDMPAATLGPRLSGPDAFVGAGGMTESWMTSDGVGFGPEQWWASLLRRRRPRPVPAGVRLGWRDVARMVSKG